MTGRHQGPASWVRITGLYRGPASWVCITGRLQWVRIKGRRHGSALRGSIKGRRHGIVSRADIMGPHHGPTSRVRITRRHQGPASRFKSPASVTGSHHEPAAPGVGTMDRPHGSASRTSITGIMLPGQPHPLLGPTDTCGRAQKRQRQAPAPATGYRAETSSPTSRSRARTPIHRHHQSIPLGGISTDCYRQHVSRRRGVDCRSPLGRDFQVT